MKTCPSDLKKCFKCGIDKDRSEFYKHAQMGDGLLGKCKECTKNDSTTRRNLKIEEVRAYDRERGKLPHRIQKCKEYARTHPEKIRELRRQWEKENPDKMAASRRSYWNRHPEKRNAHNVTSNAIRDGKLTKKPCEVCGKLKAEAHHEDYSKPLEVKWLCKPHHVEADKRRREREGRKPPHVVDSVGTTRLIPAEHRDSFSEPDSARAAART